MKPMSARVLLSRMEAAHRETRHHLDRVHRQMAGRAERIAVTQKAKARHRARKRTGARWSRSDETVFHAHLERLQFERRLELDGLTRKLTRQERAIDTLRQKLGEDAWGKAA